MLPRRSCYHPEGGNKSASLDERGEDEDGRRRTRKAAEEKGCAGQGHCVQVHEGGQGSVPAEGRQGATSFDNRPTRRGQDGLKNSQRRAVLLLAENDMTWKDLRCSFASEEQERPKDTDTHLTLTTVGKNS